MSLLFLLLLVFIVCYLLYLLILLIWPLCFPTVITYPWRTRREGEEKEHSSDITATNKTTIAIMAGSYNPPHKGHIAMIEYIASLHKKVICVIGKNPDKHYTVTPEQRADILRKMLSSQNIDVSVKVVSDYIWRYARRTFPARKANIIFYRGIRTWERDGNDETKLQILNTWGPLLYGYGTWPIPTIYLTGKTEYNHISSTLIRNICDKEDEEENEKKEALSKLVDSSTVDIVYQLYSTMKSKSS